MLDVDYMALALAEAKKALSFDEVPVGAVIVKAGEVIASAHNMCERLHDATAHAEFIAIRRAAELMGRPYLRGCVLYVTLEPCAMCMGAMVNAQLDKLVFGAFDARFGCCGSATDLSVGLGHNMQAAGGIMEGECAALLSDYFRIKRQNRR